jgi:fluoroquinolone transport system permease protein
MFTKVIKHELRNITRDRMYAFFVFYEILLIALSLWLIPYLQDTSGDLAVQITFVVLILMSGIVFGAITGFTLLDDQDDGVLFSLKVTPINVNIYIFLKLLMSYIFSVIATIILVIATGLLEMLPLIDIFFITLLSSFQGPFIALVMNAFSSNKVEGFVIMKLTGLTIIGPILALFLTDWTELLIGIFPGFWTARIMSISMLPIDFFLGPSWIYFSLGLIINVISIYLIHRYFKFKHQL